MLLYKQQSSVDDFGLLVCLEVPLIDLNCPVPVPIMVILDVYGLNINTYISI